MSRCTGGGILIVALAASSVTGQERRSLELSDLARLRAVSDAQMSPEGDWVAYVVRS